MINHIALGCSVFRKGQKTNGIDGIGVYTKNLVDGLRKEKFNFYEIFFDSNFTSFDQNKNFISINKINLIMLAYGIKSSSFNSLTQKISLFHSTDFYVPIIPQVPVIASLMDVIPFSNPEFINNNPLNNLKKHLWLKGLKSASQIITISNYSKYTINKYLGIDNNKISVIPLGVEDKFFQNHSNFSIEEVITKYDLPNSFFLTVGTIQPRKNYESLIDAYNLLPISLQQQCPLIIIGKYGWGCEKLQNYLVKMKNPNIRWLKYIDRNDLIIIYKIARAFFFISFNEGFGIPLLEAFASKTPVVYSNTTALKEIGGGYGIKINPKNIDLLSDLMKNFINDKSFGMSSLEKSYSYSKKYNWKKTISDTKSLYEKFMV